MALEIRDASVADAALVARTIRKAFAQYKGVLQPPSGAHSESSKTVRAKLPAGGALIAEQGGATVGCVLYRRYEDHMYLGRLAVPPKFRRNGVAAALIDAVEARAAQLGLHEVRLGTRVALESNVQYYMRRGYTLFENYHHPESGVLVWVMLSKKV